MPVTLSLSTKKNLSLSPFPELEKDQPSPPLITETISTSSSQQDIPITSQEQSPQSFNTLVQASQSLQRHIQHYNESVPLPGSFLILSVMNSGHSINMVQELSNH
jgi:hypothetical protein